jgi:hypothetical protein
MEAVLSAIIFSSMAIFCNKIVCMKTPSSDISSCVHLLVLRDTQIADQGFGWAEEQQQQHGSVRVMGRGTTTTKWQCKSVLELCPHFQE